MPLLTKNLLRVLNFSLYTATCLHCFPLTFDPSEPILVLRPYSTSTSGDLFHWALYALNCSLDLLFVAIFIVGWINFDAFGVDVLLIISILLLWCTYGVLFTYILYATRIDMADLLNKLLQVSRTRLLAPPPNRAKARARANALWAVYLLCTSTTGFSIPALLFGYLLMPDCPLNLYLVHFGHGDSELLGRLAFAGATVVLIGNATVKLVLHGTHIFYYLIVVMNWIESTTGAGSAATAALREYEAMRVLTAVYDNGLCPLIWPALAFLCTFICTLGLAALILFYSQMDALSFVYVQAAVLEMASILLAFKMTDGIERGSVELLGLLRTAANSAWDDGSKRRRPEARQMRTWRPIQCRIGSLCVSKSTTGLSLAEVAVTNAISIVLAYKQV